MSRIGKQPVKIVAGVTVVAGHGSVTVTGPKGELKGVFPGSEIEVKVEGDQVLVSAKRTSKLSRALHGTWRAHIANMVKGVTEGWARDLELVGTGYRAEVKDGNLVLSVGYSHPVTINAVDGLTYGVVKTTITVAGTDRQKVSQLAANIRRVRPPEPYKGKGIMYKGEIIRRKAGKAAKTAAA